MRSKICSDLSDPGVWPLQRPCFPLHADRRHPRQSCTEDYLYTSFNANVNNGDRQISHNLVLTLKAMLFFAPHIVFRTTATAFVGAFLRIYSLIPLTVYIMINFVIAYCHHIKHNRVPNAIALNGVPNGAVDDIFVSVALSLFTPVVPDPFTKFDRSLLKSTMLASTLTLLPCIIFIRLLPLLSPETIACTFGLSHLNQSSDIPPYSPCYNLTTTNSTCVPPPPSSYQKLQSRHP